MTDQTIEQAAVDQRATDPRLEQQAVVTDPIEPVVEDQELEPVEPVVEPEPQPKPRKTAEEVLKGRVGHLTKTLSTKDQELSDYKAKLAAAQELLAAKAAGQISDSDSNTIVQKPVVGPTTYSKEDFEAAVAAKAAADEFNRKADEMYNTGAAKFNDWKDTVDTLVASGFMNTDLVDAAMAVEDGAAVLHHLGTNLDEAERINALSPIRKAAEMAKISNSLNAVRNVPVSNAPTPIKPVSGSPNPQIDLQRISDDGDMSAYIAARAKQGSRWAQGRGR